MTQWRMVIGMALLLALSSAYAEPRTCRGTASGSSTTAIEIDSDMNGEFGSVGTAQGKDCHGHLTANSASELADWDQASYCDFDEYGTPSGVVLPYLSISQVLRYRTGDLLFTELDDSQLSLVCYHFDDPSSSTYEVHTIITGGTGRFEGATGTARAIGVTYALQNMSAFSGTFTSEIDLPRRHKHHDEEDR